MSNLKDKSEYIDLGEIVKLCRRKWYIFLICILGCLGVAMLYIRTHNSEYLVRANMLISTDSSDPGDSMSRLNSLFGSSANVDDELYSVSSHTVLRDVVKKLSLNKTHLTKTGFLQKRFDFEDSPIELVCNPSIADTLRSTLVFTIKVNDKDKADIKVKCRKEVIAEVENATFPVALDTPYGEYTIVTTPTFISGEDQKSTIIFSGYDKAAEDLSENLSIEIANRKANVIELALQSENIDYSRAVLDAIIEQYNLRNISQDNAKHQKTLAFLDKRLELLSEDLTDVEGNIESLKSKQGIVDIQAEVTYQFTKKGKIETELVDTETQYEILKLVRDFLADDSNSTSLVPSTLVNQSQSESNGQAITAYNDLLLQRMRIAQTARPGNKALETLDGQLEAMRSNLVTSLNKSIESYQVALRELKSKMGSTQNVLGQVPSQERVMRDIMRQRTIKEQLYIFLLQQREQIAMLLANGVEKGKVIDAAYALNDEVTMSPKRILALSVIFGILLGLFVIYLQNLLRTKFSTREELEALTDAPILGEICTNRSGQSLVIKNGKTSPTAELFRLVRSNLLFIMSNPSDKVVLMTSTKSGEGKSFISINLAASLAVLGKKVLLVGLDIRAPRLAEYMNMKPGPGFTDFVAGGQTSFDRLIQHPEQLPELDVITAGPIPPNPSELLVNPRVDEFFRDARSRYDYIIVDSAPVGIVSDSLSLSRVADATIYVCRANYTTKSDLRLFGDFYHNKRLPNLALVINGTTAKQGYGYGYGEKKE